MNRFPVPPDHLRLDDEAARTLRRDGSQKQGLRRSVVDPDLDLELSAVDLADEGFDDWGRFPARPVPVEASEGRCQSGGDGHQPFPDFVGGVLHLVADTTPRHASRSDFRRAA